MVSALTDGLPSRYRSRRPMTNVVAVLTDEPSTPAVAQLAVREAARRKAQVRFVHLTRADGEGPAADDTGNRVFLAATRALRGSGVAAVFEYAGDEPQAVVRQRAQGATLLIVPRSEPDLASWCQKALTCEVKVVPDD